MSEQSQPSPRFVTGYPSTMGDDVQLNTTTLIRHAARTHGEREIVYRLNDGGWGRYDYAGAWARIQRTGNALRSLGVQPGDRVAVVDWNSRRHFELYWAIPGLGACMIQTNLRLGPEDIVHVLTDSGASVVCVDSTLLPLMEAIAERVPHVREWVVMTDEPMESVTTSLPNPRHHETLLAQAEPTCDFPEVDERSAYAACYTTGTTGKPKGVYYSHRAIVLHAYAVATNVNIGFHECMMAITPMFHANGWGLSQACALMAAKIVLPGRYSAEETALLVDTMIREDVTISNGAPAIFLPMLHYIESLAEKPDLSRLRLMCGSSEPPLRLMKGLQDACGAEVVHAYGATETTPIASVNRYKPSVLATMTPDELLDLKRKQGFPVVGVDVRIVDGNGAELPHDGVSQGELLMRGPWITQTYHGLTEDELAGRFEDGWWRSGDIGSIDPHGYLKLTDRLKDVIKSGGEWISSIDMENLIVSHPKVAAAAVVGLEHPKWQERPFMLITPVEGEQITLEEVHDHLRAQFASWQLPERIEVVAEIPRTSVGKFDKKRIRSHYQDTYTQQG